MPGDLAAARRLHACALAAWARSERAGHPAFLRRRAEDLLARLARALRRLPSVDLDVLLGTETRRAA